MTIQPLTDAIYDTDILVNGQNEGSFQTDQDGTDYDIGVSTSSSATPPEIHLSGTRTDTLQDGAEEDFRFEPFLDAVSGETNMEIRGKITGSVTPDEANATYDFIITIEDDSETQIGQETDTYADVTTTTDINFVTNWYDIGDMGYIFFGMTNDTTEPDAPNMDCTYEIRWNIATSSDYTVDSVTQSP